MKKRKSSQQLRKILIVFIIAVVIILVTSIVFLVRYSTKHLKGRSQISISNNKTNTVEEKLVDGVIVPEDLVGAQYESVCFDNERSYKVETIDGKVYFSVFDEDKFAKKYEDAKVKTDEKIEIATHKYNIVEVYVQKLNDKEYVITLLKDGTLGIMDVEEAVNDNVLRIKKEVIKINAPIVRVSKYYRVIGDKSEEATIIVSSNGQMYDLENFVE